MSPSQPLWPEVDEEELRRLHTERVIRFREFFVCVPLSTPLTQDSKTIADCKAKFDGMGLFGRRATHVFVDDPMPVEIDDGPEDTRL